VDNRRAIWNDGAEVRADGGRIRVEGRELGVGAAGRDPVVPGSSSILVSWRAEGRGGTGKTTLAKLLAGEIDWLLDPPGQYQASVNIERYQLPGSPPVEIVVPPGQQHRRGADWDDLLADVAAGKYRGLILVTASGYQSIARGSYKDHPLYSGKKDKFVSALIDQQRAEELAILDRLIPVFGVVPVRFWLLSVVAKQDLWWPNRQEVENHYRTGEYQARLAGVFPPGGRRDRRHEVCPVSLVIQNWTTQTAGERLRPNAEGYDQIAQVSSIRRLLETLDALREWEAEA
jgi:hypothetical protein